ncbi:hypothetical protein ACTFIR_012683 [Dictyostelium discoideum]
MYSICTPIIFFLFSIISYIQCVDLIISERTFLLDLAQKVNDTKLNIIGLESIICVNILGCACDNDGYLTRLEINSYSTNAINWNDLNGFSKLQKLSINTVYIDDVNFIYKPIPTISHLVIYTFSSLAFDQPFPNYYSFECYLINHPIINLKISNFASVFEFKILNEINIEYDGVNLINNNLKYFTMVSSSIPNLTSLSEVKSFKFSTTQNYFNESSFSNILSFNGLESIDLAFPKGNSYDFPIEFSLMENPQWYSLILRFGNWKTPSQYIDLSNNQRSYAVLFIYYPGPYFNINGSIPFSKIYGNPCGSFGVINGFYTRLPDMKLLESCTGISFMNLGIGGDLPSVKDTLQKSKSTGFASLNSNKLTGTIDESWCSISVDFSNNLLTGQLPDCKYCYQNDPIYQSYYSFNKFTNYNTNATCTYEQISVYKIIVNDGMTPVVLIGKNIGFNLANIVTYPEIVFQKNNLNDSFSGKFVNGDNGSYDIIQVRFLVPGINFTISLKNSPPIVKASSFGADTIFIYGEYFSYDKSGISVEIDNGKEILNCIVEYSIFDKIICKLNIPVFVYGISSKGYLKVNGHNTTFPLSLVNTTIINGYCDDITKSCYCYSKWTRLNPYSPCSIPNHYLSSSSTVQSNIGGNITLSGWFGDVHDDPIVLLNNKQVIIESIDSETIVITIPPGAGSRSIEIIQNNITWSGLIYPYSESTINCLNNCSGNGSCNSNGECKCNDNYIGLDCSTKKDPGSTTPPTHVIINPNGTTTITNEDTVYLIYIDSIAEIDFSNNQVPNSLINLKNGWKYDNNTSNSSITNFYQNINNVLIKMTIENIESNNGKEFTFAGNQFTVSKDGFKLSLSVSNWNYKSNLNTLQIQMSSDISTTEGNKINNCIDSEHTNVETSSNSNNLQNVNYLKISKNGKTLYGRFQDKMLSDGRSTTTITKIISKDDKKVLISFDMPHCNQCLLDPDFSVIINSDFKSSDSCGKENKKSWLIPVAVTVPVVGCALIIVVFLLRKKIIHLRMEKKRMTIALKNLN